MGTLVVLLVVLALLIGGQALFVGALRGALMLVLAAGVAGRVLDPLDTGRGLPVPVAG